LKHFIDNTKNLSGGQMKKVKSKIIDQKIIGIIRGIEENKIIETIEALLDGGITLVEITLNQDSKKKLLESIKLISIVRKKFGNKISLGAGTVITAEQVVRVVDAGAEYIISPNTDIKVIKKTRDLNKISIPGAYTPSEIVTAYDAGADFVKVFPAASLGTGYIKSVRGPLSNIPLLAVGGINTANVSNFIKAGAVGVGVGGSLIDKDVINNEEFDFLKKKAAIFIEKIRQSGED